MTHFFITQPRIPDHRCIYLKYKTYYLKGYITNSYGNSDYSSVHNIELFEKESFLTLNTTINNKQIKKALNIMSSKVINNYGFKTSFF